MRNAVLVSERVYLRPVEVSDAGWLAEADAMETDTYFNVGRYPTSPLSYERWIADLYATQPPTEIQFAVCLLDGDEPIGIVGAEGLDWVNRTAETSSFLRPEYRGQGYGPEAKHLLLEYCFDVLQLEVLISTVWEPNSRSAAALAKQGYRPAGRLKWSMPKAGVLRDMLVFDVTRDDWLAARERWRAGRGASRS